MDKDWCSAPGDTILDLLKDLKLGKTEFAKKINQDIEFVNDLIAGKILIDLGLAKNLEIIFGISYSFWMKRERNYRECLKSL